MSQRVTHVVLAVAVLASVGSMTMAWFLIDQSRLVNQALLDQNRAANEALLEQMRELIRQNAAASDPVAERPDKTGEPIGEGREPAAPPRSLDWNAVTARLLSDDDRKTPLAGFTVTLSGHLMNSAAAVDVVRKSDEQGRVDLGLIRPGEHSLAIKTPWGESREPTSLVVLPGMPQDIAIVCPAGPLDPAEIDFSVVWPDDLKDQGLWLICNFIHEPRVVGGTAWSLRPRHDERIVLINPQGEAFPFPAELPAFAMSPTRERSRWPFVPGSRGGFGAGALEREQLGLMHGKTIWRYLPRGDDEPGTAGLALMEGRRMTAWHLDLQEFRTPLERSERSVRWGAATYRLMAIVAAGPPEDLTESDRATSTRRGRFGDAPSVAPLEGIRKLPVFGAVLNVGDLASFLLTRDQGHFNPFIYWEASTERGAGASTIYRDAYPTFVARTGGPNHWKIEPPAPLLERIRANPMRRTDGVDRAPPTSRRGRSARSE